MNLSSSLSSFLSVGSFFFIALTESQFSLWKPLKNSSLVYSPMVAAAMYLESVAEGEQKIGEGQPSATLGMSVGSDPAHLEITRVIGSLGSTPRSSQNLPMPSAITRSSSLSLYPLKIFSSTAGLMLLYSIPSAKTYSIARSKFQLFERRMLAARLSLAARIDGWERAKEGGGLVSFSTTGSDEGRGILPRRGSDKRLTCNP